MAIFVSYARKDRAEAQSIRRDLERGRRAVWLDDELTGGQAWWDTILANIRSCEVFVVLLSPESLRSKACQSELRYALELGRPLLPVMVKPTAVQLAPRAIADAQIIDYTERTADSAIALVTAAATMPAPPPLPDPLPEPPGPPLSYMNPYREQIDSESLPFQDQATLVMKLKGHLQDEDERESAHTLLVELRRRQDIAESVARDIDDLLASLRTKADPVAAPPPREPEAPAREPATPASESRVQPPAFAAWSPPAAAVQVPVSPVPPVREPEPRRSRRGLIIGASIAGGVAVIAIVALVTTLVVRQSMEKDDSSAAPVPELSAGTPTPGVMTCWDESEVLTTELCPAFEGEAALRYAFTMNDAPDGTEVDCTTTDPSEYTPAGASTVLRCSWADLPGVAVFLSQFDSVSDAQKLWEGYFSDVEAQDWTVDDVRVGTVWHDDGTLEDGGSYWSSGTVYDDLPLSAEYFAYAPDGSSESVDNAWDRVYILDVDSIAEILDTTQ